MSYLSGLNISPYIFFYILLVVSIFSDSHVIEETAKNNANGCGGIWKEKCLCKGLADFFEDYLEHVAVFFAWVSLEGRNSAVALDSTVALSVADSLTQHPAHVGKHSLMGDLTP